MRSGLLGNLNSGAKVVKTRCFLKESLPSLGTGRFSVIGSSRLTSDSDVWGDNNERIIQQIITLVLVTGLVLAVFACSGPPDKGKKKDLCDPSFAPPHNLESCIVQGISK
jgi:hypothetical protein